MEPEDIKQSIAGARGGDERAVALLFSQVCTVVEAQLGGKVREEHLLDDIAADIVLRLLDPAKYDLERTASFSRWVAKVARKILASYWRARKKEWRESDLVGSDPGKGETLLELEPSRELSPLEQLSVEPQADTLRKLCVAMERLHGPLQECLSDISRRHVNFAAVYFLALRTQLYRALRNAEQVKARYELLAEIVEAAVPWSEPIAALRPNSNWPTLAQLWDSLQEPLRRGKLLSARQVAEAALRAGGSHCSESQLAQWQSRLRKRLKECYDAGQFSCVDRETVTFWAALLGVDI